MKKPNAKTLALFMKRWHLAQTRKSVREMETLLEPRWLNCWYWCGPAGPYWNATRDEAIKLILQQLNLIGR